jgi:hypothetical protein
MPFALVVKGMLVELTSEVKDYLRQSASALRGFDRLRKGVHELDSGIRCVDAFSSRGRDRAEERLPGLLDDIRSLVDGSSQTDPTFHTQRLYARLSAAEVHRQLILQKGHAGASLPSEETIRRKMHAAGYSLRTVAKCRPKKSCPRRTPSSTG